MAELLPIGFTAAIFVPVVALLVVETPFLPFVDGVLLLLLEATAVDGCLVELVFFKGIGFVTTVFIPLVLLGPVPATDLETGTVFDLVWPVFAGGRLAEVAFNGTPTELPFPGVGIDLVVKPALELSKDLVLLRVAIPWLVNDLQFNDVAGLTLCARG